MKKTVLQEITIPLLLLVVFAVAAFLVLSLSKSLKNPPTLSITGPSEVSTTQDKLVISGQVDPKATLTADGNKVSVDKSGGYSYTASLKDGVQTIELVATKWYSQNKAKVTITKAAGSTVEAKLDENRVAPAPSAATTQPVVSGTSSVPKKAAPGEPLATSGPAESFMTAFGIVSMLFSVYFYRKSQTRSVKTQYKAFTIS